MLLQIIKRCYQMTPNYCTIFFANVEISSWARLGLSLAKLGPGLVVTCQAWLNLK